MSEEFAIRNEDTFQWWGAGRWTRTPEFIKRYKSYADATQADAWLGVNVREAARIVPAPPIPEMTEAECWAWFHMHALGKFSLRPRASIVAPTDRWWIGTHDQMPTEIAVGDTPCDAIRAARRVLEKKP